MLLNVNNSSMMKLPITVNDNRQSSHDQKLTHIAIGGFTN